MANTPRRKPYVLIATDRRRLGAPQRFVRCLDGPFGVVKLTTSLRLAATYGPRQAARATERCVSPTLILTAEKAEACRSIARRPRPRPLDTPLPLPLEYDATEGWQAHSIGSLCLPRRIDAALYDAGITTLGELARHMVRDVFGTLTERDEGAVRRAMTIYLSPVGGERGMR